MRCYLSKVLELFGHSTSEHGCDWQSVVSGQHCPFLGKTCIKVRKSDPDTAIGTCTVNYGREPKPIMICPFRLLERRQIFTDCLQLLTSHEPGNELHIVPEVAIPGGSVDYFLVSARDGRVLDFAGIELQTLDTTGTVWPERQRFIAEHGLETSEAHTSSNKSFGMNWKMTAKTILVQLHHKIQTFEHVNKKLALVIQDHLLEYMKVQFNFDHLSDARLGDSMHIHSYVMHEREGVYRLQLDKRLSTDMDGIATCLGLQSESRVELSEIVSRLEEKMERLTPDLTLFNI